MTLLPWFNKLEKPFLWANPSIWKMNTIGVFAAFWCSFVLFGANLLVAKRVGMAEAPIVMAFFYLFFTLFAVFSGLIARAAVSRKNLLLIGLGLMFVGTVAINFVNSIGLFALVHILMATGYATVISVAGHLTYDFLDDGAESLSRGRSAWGTCNRLASLLGFLTSLLFVLTNQLIWSAIAIASLLGAAYVVLLLHENRATTVRPVEDHLEEKLPFYPPLINKDESVQFSWPYALVVACSLALRMWPVLYMETWLAVAMIVGVELTNALVGPAQVQALLWLAKKDKFSRLHICQRVTIVMLVALAVSLLFVASGVAALCIIAAVIIGIAMRVFAYLEITLVQQKKRGSFTFFIVTGVGQCICCLAAMVSIHAFAFVLLPFVLVCLTYHWRQTKV